ncbi:MAG: ribonuclease PH [Clostridia bacterium]|nr:ribonuclease PH [Clostridia bacterium]
MRSDGRSLNETRNVKITRDFTKYAKGSVLIETGETKVIVTASVDEKVPPFKKDTGSGFITAEYSMLPGATAERNSRDIQKLKLNGRSAEIQRLIGRCIRAGFDMDKLGERTIQIDCDVIQADGGTRTASITGAFVATLIAVAKLMDEGLITENPVKTQIAAVSLGKVGGEIMTDLCYEEDCRADVDMNLILDGDFNIVEIQGAAEHGTYKKAELDELFELGAASIARLFDAQKAVLKENELALLK